MNEGKMILFMTILEKVMINDKESRFIESKI